MVTIFCPRKSLVGQKIYEFSNLAIEGLDQKGRFQFLNSGLFILTGFDKNVW